MSSGSKKFRYIFLQIFTMIIGICLIFRLVQLQIIMGDEFKERSENRILKSIKVKSPRGEIFDRYGRPFAVNYAGYSVQIQKTDISISDDKYCDMLLKLLKILNSDGNKYVDSFPISKFPFEYTFKDKKDEVKWKSKNELDKNLSAIECIGIFRRKYRISQKYSLDELRDIIGVRYEMQMKDFSINTPFTIATQVNYNIVTELEEKHLEFYGVNIIDEPIRCYPHEELAAHIIGNVGMISAEEYEKLKIDGYGVNDIVGKSGMEKVLEEQLRGKEGIMHVEQDKDGKVTKILDVDIPVQGNSAILTIDMNLQRVAEDALSKTITKIREGGYKNKFEDANIGAVVVMDVNTGEILAMASYPSYNLDEFYKDYTKLNSDPLAPMFNRAINGTYSPGSTFKMLTAIAALEEGIIKPTEKMPTKGLYTYYDDYQPRCWIYTKRNGYGNHGRINVSQALKYSCNYFFYDLGRRLTIDNLTKYGKIFGFGQSTGLEIGGSKGIMSNPQYKKQVSSEPWYPGETLMIAIGQKSVFTPIQLAGYVSTIANGGKRYSAHLLKRVKNEDGKTIKEIEPEILDDVDIKAQNLEAVFKGMRGVTEEFGTASSTFADFPITVAGKTGTAQRTVGSDDGLFVGFAPYDNPQIGVAVVIEHGGHGGYTAPVAREIFAAYLGLSSKKDNYFPVNILTK